LFVNRSTINVRLCKIYLNRRDYFPSSNLYALNLSIKQSYSATYTCKEVAFDIIQRWLSFFPQSKIFFPSLLIYRNLPPCLPVQICNHAWFIFLIMKGDGTPNNFRRFSFDMFKISYVSWLGRGRKKQIMPILPPE
jgi:hypothetical protein